MGLDRVSLFSGCSAKELRDELKAAVAWFVVRFLAYRLGSHFSEEMNPVGKGSRVSSFHVS